MTALARTEGTPALGSTLDRLLRQMLTYSDNAAANGTERYFGGSTSGGSALVNAMMRSLGLVDTEMYGGYELDAVGGPPRAPRGRDSAAGRQPAELGPRQADDRVRPREPAARRLARERRAWARSGRRSPGFTPADAPLPALSARPRARPRQARSRGRPAARASRVLHKAGWINAARHDNGIVLWPGGALVVTVMTYRPAGAGVSSDVLAGGSRRRRCVASAADRPMPG